VATRTQKLNASSIRFPKVEPNAVTTVERVMPTAVTDFEMELESIFIRTFRTAAAQRGAEELAHLSGFD
jgi:hypothetical protein